MCSVSGVFYKFSKTNKWRLRKINIFLILSYFIWGHDYLLSCTNLVVLQPTIDGFYFFVTHQRIYKYPPSPVRYMKNFVFL